MYKASFSKKKLHLWSFGLTIQAGRDFITHPYRNYKIFYPICAIIFMFAKWSFTMSVYKPANVMLNRAERRANHMK